MTRRVVCTSQTLVFSFQNSKYNGAGLGYMINSLINSTKVAFFLFWIRWYCSYVFGPYQYSFEAHLDRKISATFMTGLVIFASTPIYAQQASSSTNQTPAPIQQPSATAQAPQTPPKPNTLLDGTPVKLRLGRTLSSANAKVGDEVDFDVLEDIKVKDVIVIPKGGLALATITSAEHKKRMGRGGRLDVNIDSVRLADNEKAALRSTAGGKAGGHVGVMTTAIVATGIVFFPAAPLFLFIHGKEMVIPKGTEITAYVNGDMTLDMARFAPMNGTPETAATAAGTFQITVDANVPNCDIEIDGAFAGNTPSQLSLSAGKHEITVKKKGYQNWTRTLAISGSGIHLNAELAPETTAPANALASKPN